MRALIPLLSLFLLSCDEVRKSDSPVSPEEALKLADVRLPLPSSASDVQFRLSGGTQDWDLFVSFSAPEADTETMIKAELESDRKTGANLQPGYSGIDFEKHPITPATIPDLVGYFPPRWWHPADIKKGYFVGPLDGGRAPRFWVDTQANRTFFFQHF